VVEGAAFSARKNSLHHFNGVKTFLPGGDRFFQPLDSEKAKIPGPGTYRPKQNNLFARKASHITLKSDRFLRNQYQTEAPGPGSYRSESGFGIYSLDGSMRGELPSDAINRIKYEMGLASP